MKTKSDETEPTCCPEFDPNLWDDKLIEWKNKKFIRDKVCTFFYMPLNFGKTMKRLDKLTSEAGLSLQDGLCLSDHTSKWNMDIYLAVVSKRSGRRGPSMCCRKY